MIDFKNYDNENPKIWDAFVRYSFDAKQKGFDCYSAKGIFEIIRWHTGITGNDGFKLNNNYHADYARKLMDKYPTFIGFFKTRKIKTGRV